MIRKRIAILDSTSRLRSFEFIVKEICRFTIFSLLLINLSSCAFLLTPADEGGPGKEDFSGILMDHVKYDFRIEDSFTNPEEHVGEIIRWSGMIVEMNDNRLLLSGITQKEINQAYILILIDHPVTSQNMETGLPVSLSVGQTVRVIGRFMGLKEMDIKLKRTVLPQFRSTVPQIECYMITRHNDKNFLQPVWVTARYREIMRRFQDLD